MYRKTIALSMMLLLLLMAVSCAPQNRPAPTPAPTQPAPSQSMQTENNKADAIAKKVSQINDINSATVVLSGNSAWVGIDLKANVENKMSNETKNDVTRVVKEAEPNINTVYVTADADTVTRLKNMARDIAAGKPVSGFVNELNEIGRRITPSAE